MAPPTPRFCTTCGAAWDPASASCLACAPRAAAVAAGISAPARQEGPSVRGAIWLYFALLLASIIGIGAIALGAEDDADATHYSIGISAAHTLIVACWAIAARRQIVPTVAPPRARWYPIALALAPVTFIIATIVIKGGARLVGLEEILLVRPFLDAGYGWGAIVFWNCVQPAVVEEIAFRGVVLGSLQRSLTVTESVIVSSLLFALLHLSMPSLPHLMLIGLALAWLRVASGSLLPGMVMHFAHNALCVAGEAWGL